MAFKAWSIDKMYDQLDYLRSLPDDKKTPQCLDDIINLENLLNIGNGEIPVFDFPATFREQLMEDMLAIEAYQDFLFDVKVFSENAPVFHGFDVGAVNVMKNITPNMIFKFLKEFFQQFDSEFGKTFYYVYRERFHNIKFSNNRPISYHLPSIPYSYLNLSREHTIEDFLNAVHEYTHAIVDHLCYHDSSIDYPFGELVSVFMELVAADYLMEEYSKLDKDVNTLRLSSCKNLVIYAENISIEHDYFSAPREIDDWKKAVQSIQDISGKSKRYIRNLLQTTALEKLSYTVPYITAIELYYLYLQDKKTCIKVLKYLIYLEANGNYNEKLKECGILLNTHSTDWVDTLISRKK